MNNDCECNPPEDLTPTVELRSLAPSIHVGKLKKGTMLLLEGGMDIYELIVLHPENGLVAINSNNFALRQATVGQFMHSVRRGCLATKLATIQQGWEMVLRFSNGVFHTEPIMSARVSGTRDDGSRWFYDVF
jgi:hypothetical protein